MKKEVLYFLIKITFMLWLRQRGIYNCGTHVPRYDSLLAGLAYGELLDQRTEDTQLVPGRRRI